MGKWLISQVCVCVVATEKATALLTLMKSVMACVMIAIRKNLHKARLSGFFKLRSPHSHKDTPVLNILFVTRQARDFKISPLARIFSPLRYEKIYFARFDS